MTVSNEDREPLPVEVHSAAVQALYEVEGCDCKNCLVDALVSHGWGPRPRVSRAEIAAAFGPVHGPSMALSDRLVVFLRGLGIEVTDGD